MPRTNRKSAMKVVDGTVKRKNNWEEHAADYMSVPQKEIVLDRLDPGPGRRHLLTIAHLREYLDMVVEFDRRWIDAIVLNHDPGSLGWYQGGVVALCSWEADLWWPSCWAGFVEELAEPLALIGVEHERKDDGTDTYEIRWTADQIRAFQLTYILSHELGHHHDMLTNRSWRCSRGEPYAEAYGLDMMRAVWPEYVRRFAV